VTTLVIELSKKPLIILFWIGSFTAFLAGALAMIDRKLKAGREVFKDETISVGASKEVAF
jgi:cytochrome c biogenesis factor